jgi:hypothetical protein
MKTKGVDDQVHLGVAKPQQAPLLPAIGQDA